MDMFDEIARAAEYDNAAIDAATLKTAYAIWGPEGVRERLREMGPVAAAKAEAVLKHNGDIR